jgi:hypothetical protein
MGSRCAFAPTILRTPSRFRRPTRPANSILVHHPPGNWRTAAMINWREKLIAFLLHFLTTLAIAGCAAALVFLIWYPGAFLTMAGGLKFFLLITGCDLVLGPLISLVIYNSRKTRRALIIDYTVVGIVQLVALGYGLYIIESSRPVYVAFVVDRLEVVTAAEIADSDLAAAKPPYTTRPKWGPQLIGTKLPTDTKESNELVFSSLSGKDVHVLPKYYVPFEAVTDAVKRTAEPIEALEKRHPSSKPVLAEALAAGGLDADRVRWLPVGSNQGFWTALIDAQTGRPVRYIPYDPW